MVHGGRSREYEHPVNTRTSVSTLCTVSAWYMESTHVNVSTRFEASVHSVHGEHSHQCEHSLHGKRSLQWY